MDTSTYATSSLSNTMAVNVLLANAGAIAFQLIFPPFLAILCGTLILASLGKSLGIRRMYVNALVVIFEVRQRQCASKVILTVFSTMCPLSVCP